MAIQPHLMVRVNHRIQAKKVRVRDERGKSPGVMPTDKALKLALDQGLDLVEIDSQRTPPVCQIVDFGKYRYRQSRKKA